MSEVSKAAAILGKRGGLTNAKKGRQYFSELGKLSAAKKKIQKKLATELTS